jgi:hypothetical protein
MILFFSLLIFTPPTIQVRINALLSSKNEKILCFGLYNFHVATRKNKKNTQKQNRGDFENYGFLKILPRIFLRWGGGTRPSLSSFIRGGVEK